MYDGFFVQSAEEIAARNAARRKLIEAEVLELIETRALLTGRKNHSRRYVEEIDAAVKWLRDYLDGGIKCKAPNVMAANIAYRIALNS